jgi:hypothetical protein
MAIRVVEFSNYKIREIARIRVFKVDYFILPLFLVPKLRSVAKNEWKKHPYLCIFFYFHTVILPD